MVGLRGKVIDGRCAWLAAALAAAAFGCSESTPSADLGPAAAADAAVDRGPPAVVDSAPDRAAAGTLSVTVVKADGVQLADFTRTPAAGVSVTADLPGGLRVEQTTDGDGKVVFDDVQWSKGSAAITAYAPGYALITSLGLTAADGAQTLVLIPYRSAQLVHVSGTAKNVSSEANYLAVAGDILSGRYEGDRTSFDLALQAGKPFTLYAAQGTWQPLDPQKPRDLRLDYHGWTKASHAGSRQPIAIDLDFAAEPLAPIEVAGTIKLPPTAKTLYRDAVRVQWWVDHELPGLLLGAATRVTEQPGAEFAWEGVRLAVPQAHGVRTIYAVRLDFADWGHTSFVRVDGYPQPGATIDSFLDAPTLVQPADLIKPLALGETVQWQTDESEALPLVHVWDPNAGRAIWRLRGKPGMTSLALPEAPAAAVQALVPAGDNLSARVLLCAELDELRLACAREAGSRAFLVAPPSSNTATTTGRIVAAVSYEPVAGARVCIKDAPAAACATTDASGYFILADVPIDRDVIQTAEKSDFLTGALHRGKQQRSIYESTMALFPRALTPIWEDQLGVSIDPAKGQLGLSATTASGRPLTGVTFAVSTMGGEHIYYGDLSDRPDRDLDATSEKGWGGCCNIPPATEFEVSATNSAGKPCAPVIGWPGSTLYAAKLTSMPDTVSLGAFVCP